MLGRAELGSYKIIYSAVKYGCNRSQEANPVWLATSTMANRHFIS